MGEGLFRESVGVSSGGVSRHCKGRDATSKMKMLSAGLVRDVFAVDGVFLAEFASAGLIKPHRWPPAPVAWAWAAQSPTVGLGEPTERALARC
jgi:hypothetical protein